MQGSHVRLLRSVLVRTLTHSDSKLQPQHVPFDLSYNDPYEHLPTPYE